MLDHVVDLLSVERRRDHREAAPWRTDPYARLILADAFARTGDRARALSLATEAKAGFERVMPDEIATFALAMFAARREQAMVPLSRSAALPGRVELARAGLQRALRYKTDRLIEHCRTLVPRSAIDAIDSWLKRETNPAAVVPSSLATALRDLDRERRATRIAEICERGEPDDCRIALAALVELDAEVAFPALGSIVASARTAPADIAALGCFAAARFGFGELVPALVQRVFAAIDNTLAPDSLAAILCPMLRALRWLGLEAELVALVEHTRRAFAIAELPDGPRLVLASVLASFDDPEGTSLLDAAAVALPDGFLRVDRLAPVRALADGATYGGARGHALLARLRPIYMRVSDDFGTNSNFCVSVLYFIDALATAHVDLFLANANVLDPAVAPLFASGFVA